MNDRTFSLVRVALAASFCVLFTSTPSDAQSIRARVMLMVDTSGSMTEHFTDNNTTGGDGSISYTDGIMTRSLASDLNLGLYVGYETAASKVCPGPSTLISYDGTNSRLFSAKAAVTNVLNASGDIDWGLMRYTGTVCGFSSTKTFHRPCGANSDCAPGICSGGSCICNNNNQCRSNNCDMATGLCVCGDDNDCKQGNNGGGGTPTFTAEYCVSDGLAVPTKHCVVNGNFCFLSTDYGDTSTRPAWNSKTATTCGNRTTDEGITYGGSCGTALAGGVGTACATPQLCNADTDCTGTLVGRCKVINSNPITGVQIKTCQCNVANASCAGNFTCDTTANQCVYKLGCRSPGGTILVDPATTTDPTSKIFPYVDGVEDFRDDGTGNPKNPELRAVGSTPLAGAARAATAWYNGIKAGGTDPNIACRPYILVQMTDGDDTCDNNNGGSTTAGPVAAAQGFVAATAAGARVPNKVYVIGLSSGSGGSPATLNAIAAAGGTTAARFANSQTDIEAALADIVASSVLVEKCNGLDDDCDNICDNGFPDVAIPANANNTKCTNRGTTPATNGCNNGALPGTHCFATGTFVCSADQLSEVCSAATCPVVGCPGAAGCSANPLCKTLESAGGCNLTDDDCNGVVDDCTPFVANSCTCTCTPTGPEICDGIDNDCNGTIDDNPIDVGQSCGINVGQCMPGTSACCAGGNPATCNTHVATNQLTCVGGVKAAPIACNGCDNDCDGQIDRPGQACYPPADSGCTFAGGVWTCKGTCRVGNQICNQNTCPGAVSFGACSGAQGKVAEVCDGLDNDCDGTTDNGNPGGGATCCSTGTASDCTNSGGGTTCKSGTVQCTAGALKCTGSVAKAPESCNAVDDDCNGVTDDVPGKGGACTGAGIKTLGQCRAAFNCVAGPPGPGPGGLTCVQTTGPVAETCNGLDDNCDGTTDEGNPGGGAVCGSNVGVCKTGINNCVNGAIVCQGGVQASAEICDNKDNNCDGTTDNAVTDPWINQACCSTGNISDCTNTGTGSRCSTGKFICAAGGLQQCSGGVAKSVEVCNGIDDDCDGIIDNVPGLNTACTGAGVNTQGICTGKFVCLAAPGPGPGGMTCVQNQGPMASETCNGLDDNCNGTTDEGNPGGGAACGLNCPGGLVANCKGQCKTGTMTCLNGGVVCSGSVGPSPEVCDNVDNNCDGTTDNMLTDPWLTPPNNVCCPTGVASDCVNTGGATRCKSGTFACVAGTKTCQNAVAKSLETCDLIDNDCNGATDDVAGIGTSCTSAGVNTKGVCTAAYACGATPGPGPNGLTCTQVVGPTAELCNGLDDNCDGTIDNSPTDVGGMCGLNCPGGQLVNCVGQCKPGTIQCMNGAKLCGGSIGPTAETCDNKDNDCNGLTDDVAGKGAPCSSGGVNVTGQCTAAYTCNGVAGPGPNGLTCTQTQGPVSESCNALDDDCNGLTDDGIASMACGPNCPGGNPANCVGVCKAGTTACVNGTTVCNGSNGGSVEVCDNLDNDCDGVTDNNLSDPWVNTACCPTGNAADCMNTGTGSRCHPGAFQCVAGMRTCTMAVAKSPEVCDGIDNDCNGLVDDVPGIGSPCSGGSVKTAGPCTASYQCNGMAGTGPNGLTCTQQVGPTPEMCNGIDDDCDGTIDNNLGSDMRVGVTGGVPCTPLMPLDSMHPFPAGGPTPPCSPGVTACKGGAVVCQGEVGPQPNLCNGVATDCTGNPNTNGSCPSGFMCYQGNCVNVCSGGEFPCPGGFRCDVTQNPPTGLCVPDKCAMANCQAGFNCVIDSGGNASCVDPCTLVSCPSDYTCKLGVCLDCSNPQVGCPSGEKCAGSPPKCVNDPCFNVMCPSGQFCDSNGNCSNPCVGCLQGQICINGMCQDDPCTGVHCPASEVCVIEGGMAHCVVNQCSGGCNPGLVCCQGAMCINDPCFGFSCPIDTECKMDDVCNPSCHEINKDVISAQGGGGVPGCGYGGSGGATPFGAILLLLLGMGLARRRRS